jgi:hypothetical protein
MAYLTTPNLGGANLGGGIKGISPKQSLTNYKDGDVSAMRRVLVKSWNTAYATGTVNGHNRVITPFRAVMNTGDFLSRKNYSCGGPNPSPMVKRAGYNMGNILSACDNTGIPPSSCNVKWVSDASDYTRFKKQQAVNRNFNDYSFGGDQHHASYVSRMAVHRY